MQHNYFKQKNGVLGRGGGGGGGGGWGGGNIYATIFLHASSTLN